MGLFGGGNSSSSTSNLNENIDQKQQLGNGTVGGTASNGGTVNINTSDMGAVNSAFTYGNAAVNDAFTYGNAITDGTLKFANAQNDTNAKLVNATVDDAFKTLDSTMASTTKAMQATTASAMMLANGATDSALRFGDSTVQQAFDLTKMITQGAANQVAASATQTNQMVNSALGAVKDAYSTEASTLADAYTNAKAGEQKIMAAGALAILAIVAIKVLK
jgi:hypothetical protein